MVSTQSLLFYREKRNPNKANIRRQKLFKKLFSSTPSLPFLHFSPLNCSLEPSLLFVCVLATQPNCSVKIIHFPTPSNFQCSLVFSLHPYPFTLFFSYLLFFLSSFFLPGILVSSCRAMELNVTTHTYSPYTECVHLFCFYLFILIETFRILILLSPFYYCNLYSF